MTVAAFTELALYHPLHGYYSTSRQRSGAAGDFFTSVDVGPLFGEMLAVQIAEVWTRLKDRQTGHFDLVEAGAGNGRLTLRHPRHRGPGLSRPLRRFARDARRARRPRATGSVQHPPPTRRQGPLNRVRASLCHQRCSHRERAAGRVSCPPVDDDARRRSGGLHRRRGWRTARASRSRCRILVWMPSWLIMTCRRAGEVS